MIDAPTEGQIVQEIEKFLTLDEIEHSLPPMRDQRFEFLPSELRERNMAVPSRSGNGWEIVTRRADFDGKIRECKCYRKVRGQ